jgi:Holliday junction resolvase RusA-like endonuclease
MNAVRLPWPPVALSNNGRASWQQKWRAGQQYRSIAAVTARSQCPPIVRLFEPVVAIIPLTVVRRKRDLDNITGAMKSMLDGLTDAGWWDDDSDMALLMSVKTPPRKAWEDPTVLVYAGERCHRGQWLADIDELVRRIEMDDNCENWLEGMCEEF